MTLHGRQMLDRCGDLREFLPTKLRVRNFSRLELTGDTHLVSVLQESDGVPGHVRKVVIRDSRADLYTLYVLLLALMLTLAPLQLVLIAAVVDDPANRGIGGLGYKDEVQAMVFCHGESFSRGGNSDLLALRVNQPDFAESKETLVDHWPGSRAAFASKWRPAYGKSLRSVFLNIRIRSIHYIFGLAGRKTRGHLSGPLRPRLP